MYAIIFLIICIIAMAVAIGVVARADDQNPYDPTKESR